MNLVINDDVNTNSNGFCKTDLPLKNLTDIQERTENTFQEHISDSTKFPLNSLLKLGCGVGLTAVGILGITFTLPLTTPIAIMGSLGSASLSMLGMNFIGTSSIELKEPITTLFVDKCPEKVIQKEVLQIEQKKENKVENKNNPQIVISQETLLTELSDLIDLSIKERSQIRLAQMFLAIKPKISEYSSFERFLDIFFIETKKRIIHIEFNPIENEELNKFTKIIQNYNQFHADHDAFEHIRLKEYQIAKLISLTSENLNSYQELLDILKQTYAMQRDSLQPQKLSLNAFIPLDQYDYELDVYYKNHKNRLFACFKTDPEEFPTDILSVYHKKKILVNNLQEFKNYKNQYVTASQNHEKMRKCLPKSYPIAMPNFLNPDDYPNLVIQNEEEFKKLISAYTTYLNALNALVNEIASYIYSKKLLKYHVNTIS